MALGVLLLAVAGSYFVAAALAESRLSKLEVRPVGEPVVSDTPHLSVGYGTPTLPATDEGMRLVIPAIEVDSPVVHTTQEVKDGQLTWATPPFAVGHLEGTAPPGEAGNSVMVGHILTLTEGSVFRRLTDIPPLLEQGQPVFVWATTSQGRFLYRVRETRVVEPEDVWVAAPTEEPTLTLITCIPSWNPIHRLVVTATLDSAVTE